MPYFRPPPKPKWMIRKEAENLVKKAILWEDPNERNATEKAKEIVEKKGDCVTNEYGWDEYVKRNNLLKKR